MTHVQHAKGHPSAAPRSTHPPRNRIDRAETAGADQRLSLAWSFGYLFKEGHRAFTKALTKRLAPHGITLAQWYFLRELWEQEGLTQRELSRRMAVAEPTTATAIELMERRHLIERRRGESDRRRLHIYLTNKGRNLRQNVISIVREVNDEALRRFSASEISEARDAMLRMMKNLEDEQRRRA